MRELSPVATLLDTSVPDFSGILLFESLIAGGISTFLTLITVFPSAVTGAS